MLLDELEEAVALEIVGEREERIRSRHAEELALLGGAAGGGSGRLAEHEERGGLRAFELRNRGGDVLVAVEDEQEVRLVDRSRRRRLDHVESERRASVLRVALVVEVHVVTVLRNV